MVEAVEKNLLFMRSMADGPFYGKQPMLVDSLLPTWWGMIEAVEGDIVVYYTTPLGSMVEGVLREDGSSDSGSAQPGDDEQVPSASDTECE